MLTFLEHSTNVEGFSELNRHHNLLLKQTHKKVECVLGGGASWISVDMVSGEQRVNNVSMRFFQLRVAVKSRNTRKLSWPRVKQSDLFMERGQFNAAQCDHREMLALVQEK